MQHSEYSSYNYSLQDVLGENNNLKSTIVLLQ